MDIATEAERKYELPEAFTAPELEKIGQLGEEQLHDLDATYFDTADLRLARNRVTLRRRAGGTDAGWHLKTPGGGGDRTEHRLPLGDGPAEQVPEPLLAEVRALLRDRSVEPVARLRTRRREIPLCDGNGRVLALIAHDTVRAEVDGTEQRWRELEVELVDGDRKVLQRVEKRLLAAGARPAGGPSKLARALGDRLRDAHAVPAPGGPAAVRAVVDYVRAQRDAIVARDPGVRRGDPKAVHAMRVATRRLRSTLRTFGGLWAADDRTQRLRDELSWLADRLGGVRDTQVMTARLHEAVRAQPPEAVVGPVDQRIREHLDADLEQGRRALAEALDDQRYLRLLDALDDLVDSRPERVRGRWVRRRAARALRRADAKLDEAAAAPPVNPSATPAQAAEQRHHRDEALHDARKAYKRARYAVEVFGPVAGQSARDLAERLTDLQDVLGDHQDAVITAALLREYAGRAHTAGDNGFSYGVLYAEQLAAGERAVDNVAAARRAAGRRSLRRWLR